MNILANASGIVMLGPYNANWGCYFKWLAHLYNLHMKVVF